MTPSMRGRLTRSPRAGHAISATMKGAVKLIEAAFASGRYLTPVKKQNVEISSITERAICHFGADVVVRRTKPNLGANKARMNIRWPAVRSQTIWSDG